MGLFVLEWLYIYVTALVNMNRITISLTLFIMISFILPATAIKHASGSTDNVTSSSGESTSKDTSSNSQKSNLVGSERRTSVESCTIIPPEEPPAVFNPGSNSTGGSDDQQ